MDGDAGQRLAAEQRARVLIDRRLAAAGWSVQDRQDLNLFAAQGVACRVQAKRYAEDRTIDRPRIHEFAGALPGKQGGPWRFHHDIEILGRRACRGGSDQRGSS